MFPEAPAAAVAAGGGITFGFFFSNCLRIL